MSNQFLDALHEAEEKAYKNGFDDARNSENERLRKMLSDADKDVELLQDQVDHRTAERDEWRCEVEKVKKECKEAMDMWDKVSTENIRLRDKVTKKDRLWRKAEDEAEKNYKWAIEECKAHNQTRAERDEAVTKLENCLDAERECARLRAERDGAWESAKKMTALLHEAEARLLDLRAALREIANAPLDADLAEIAKFAHRALADEGERK